MSPQLVIAILSYVPNPRKGLVPALLDDLQVTHLDPRSREIRNLELDLYGRLSFQILAFNTWKTKVGSHQVFLAARERLDAPDDGTLLRGVLDVTDGRLELRRVGVSRHWDYDLNVVGRGPTLELGFGLHHVLDPGVGMALDDRFDPDQGLDMGVEPVRHQFELAVWGYERDGAVVFEPGQSHALVELDVFQLYRLRLASSGTLEQDLVVQSQTQLWHAGQVDPHLDASHDLTAEDVAIRVGQQVDGFNHVEEHFVLAVLDPFRSPRDGIRDGHRWSGLGLHLVALLGDELLQDLAVCGLGIPEIHQLIQQFVNDDEVVPDALLLQLLEVLDEHLNDLMQEDENEGDICVLLGGGNDIQVVVLDVHECHSVVG